MLRHCLPASIRRTLDQLPKSLDENYLHVLSQIPQANQAHAHRMLQCLVVAVRPLRVEELAELLAFEFDAAQGGIPKYRAAWRLDDKTQAVLSTCSSLVTIVSDSRYSPYNDSNSPFDDSNSLYDDSNSPYDDGYLPYGGQVVQFSHFSVKEFLLSNRLGDFSRYHIHRVSAHTTLTRACLGSLLHLDDHINEESDRCFSLAEYAARHWVEHARFEDVASRIKDGMETLFDSDRPHFAAWTGIYDIDRPRAYGPAYLVPDFSDLEMPVPPKSKPNPLYYSVLCGFYDLVKHLAIKYPQYINAFCGRHRFPLFAALSEGHIGLVVLLIEHGADPNVREMTGKTALLWVLSRSISRPRYTVRSTLHLAAEFEGQFEVAQMLLMYDGDVNSRDINGRTPLHMLSESLIDDEDGVLNLALLLLKHGAKVNIRDKYKQNPLHLAVRRGRSKLAVILLEHGANARVQNNEGRTMLHILSESRNNDDGNVIELALLLLKHGTQVNIRDKNNQTSLYLAALRDRFRLAVILLEHGADANAENNNGQTPLHALSESQTYDTSRGGVRGARVAQLLPERGVDIYVRDKNRVTPSYLQINFGPVQVAQALLDRGANVNAGSNGDETSLYQELEGEYHIQCDSLGIS